MKKRLIKAIDFNWFATPEAADEWQTHTVGEAGVRHIRDVSENDAVCYRVEFEDGTAELIFNPNRVFDAEVDLTGLLCGFGSVDMSWRHVFDCKIPYKYPDEAARKAAECGYKFFAWNAKVLFILSPDGKWAETGIEVAELLRFYESA